MIKVLSSLMPRANPTAAPIQDLGTVGNSLTVAGSYVKFTTGASPVGLNLEYPTDTTITQRLTVSITQGSTARAVTLLSDIVVSAGGLVGYGTVLPNSGPSKTDIFVFEWNGSSWECVDLRFDVR